MSQIHLIKKDEKVGASEAALLGMLKIFPFSYGLQIEMVYDSGTIFEPHVLDITDNDLRNRFMAAVTNVACVSLAIGYPTIASVPHSIANGFKNLVAIALATDINFKQAEQMKEMLSDPAKMAAMLAAASAAAPAAGGGAAAEKKEEAKKPEPESESEDDDMGFGLFD